MSGHLIAINFVAMHISSARRSRDSNTFARILTLIGC